MKKSTGFHKSDNGAGFQAVQASVLVFVAKLELDRLYSNTLTIYSEALSSIVLYRS